MNAVAKPDNLDVAFEGDLAVVHVRGDYDLAAEQYLAEIRRQQARQHGYRLTLMVVTQGGTVTRDARRALIAYRDEANAPGSLAFVGASFAARTIASMALQAARALTRRPLQFQFFATEQEARAWLSEERERIRPQKPNP